MSQYNESSSERVALCVMGLLKPAERTSLEAEAVNDPVLREELDEAQRIMAAMAMKDEVFPPPALRTRMLEAVRNLQAARKADGRPPVLHPQSRATDYTAWLDPLQLNYPTDAGPLHVIELHEQDGELTALVWLTDGSPEEVHVDVVEKFLILEGSCEITVGRDVHILQPGSYLSIPLHVPHTVRVTSAKPCKILLQRIAA
jgi:mannose-6-phosphate isomerase-like protein (cupin superfamily)